MSGEGTTYAASIDTPAGLTYTCTITVPADAEHDGQHDLTQVVEAGVARMIGMDARRRHEDVGGNDWCTAIYFAADALGGGEYRCALPAPHHGPHYTRPNRWPWRRGLTWGHADEPPC